MGSVNHPITTDQWTILTNMQGGSHTRSCNDLFVAHIWSIHADTHSMHSGSISGGLDWSAHTPFHSAAAALTPLF